jgi:tetratricopeptide (TPR) repeat protein
VPRRQVPRVTAGHESDRLKTEARAEFAAGRLESARARFAEVLRQHPKDLDAREGLLACVVAIGHSELDRGEIDAAISHFQMALELSPFHPGADAGLRKADALARERAPKDALGTAIEALPPVKVFRELQLAERTVAKVTGTTPASRMVRDRMEAREAGLAAAGGPRREQRIERERAAAWNRRWLFRAAPGVAVVVSALLALAFGSFALLGWGLLVAAFAALWDVIFVERGGPPREADLPPV